MRSKKALFNVISSLALQIVVVICGFIVPRLLIGTFGSSVNGVVTSISQFLGYITLLESGVGGVVRAALYKPLAQKNTKSISGIIKATESFFRKIAIIYIIYSLLVAAFLPYVVRHDFDWVFVASLVLIISLSTFVQYYYGITYQMLLQADQKKYITSLLQIFTTIANTIVVVFLVRLGASIHLVRLGSAAIYVIRPLALNFYVKRTYELDQACPADNHAINQRWDGLGHHIAYFLHRHTDVAVLTLFTNTRLVSVYSVYYMVVSGIEKITATFSSGLEAAFGNMIANNEVKSLNRNFRLFEFMSFAITTSLFTSTAVLVLSFVAVYTKGVTDVNYHRPLFAYTLIAAEAIYCIRIPYHSVTLAAGHYKQTRNGAFAEAIINIVLSVSLVKPLKLEGVAIATFCAMLYRTIQYALYISKQILKRSMGIFYQRCLVNIAASAITIKAAGLLPVITINSYGSWLIYAVEVTLIALMVTFAINTVIYFKDAKSLLQLIKRLITRKAGKMHA